MKTKASINSCSGAATVALRSQPRQKAGKSFCGASAVRQLSPCAAGRGRDDLGSSCQQANPRQLVRWSAEDRCTACQNASQAAAITYKLR